MNKEIATTYKEYKNGATQVAGFGRLGCYQGLDYIENILKNDKYYSEKLEDGFIFIQSYINCIEQQCKKQKEVIDKAMSILKDNFIYDYVRSCDTTDGVGYDEIDTEHFTYKVYEILNEVSK